MSPGMEQKAAKSLAAGAQRFGTLGVRRKVNLTNVTRSVGTAASRLVVASFDQSFFHSRLLTISSQERV